MLYICGLFSVWAFPPVTLIFLVCATNCKCFLFLLCSFFSFSPMVCGLPYIIANVSPFASETWLCFNIQLSYKVVTNWLWFFHIYIIVKWSVNVVIFAQTSLVFLAAYILTFSLLLTLLIPLCVQKSHYISCFSLLPTPHAKNKNKTIWLAWKFPWLRLIYAHSISISPLQFAAF